MTGDLASIAASICWAITPIVATKPLRNVGALNYTIVRFTISSIILTSLVFFLLGGFTYNSSYGYFALSGFLGLFLGDTLLFLALKILGPSKCSVIFSLNAPITVFLGYLFFGTLLAPKVLMGCFLCLSGAIISNQFRQKKSLIKSHQKSANIDALSGSQIKGVFFALAAALFQALGILTSKHAYQLNEVSAVEATTVRVIIGGIFALL